MTDIKAIRVIPLARTAAIIMLSVAPTEIEGNFILEPDKPFGAIASM